jgi:hypothetical protein
VQGSIRQAPRDDPSAFAVSHDEIKNEILDEKLGSSSEGLPVQGVDQSVSGSIGCRARTRDGAFAKIAHVAAERPLVNPAVIGARKRHACVLKFDDGRDGLPTHVFDCVLIAEPVRPLHGVEHVPLPTIFAEIAEAGRNSTLGRDRVTPCRKYL